MPKTALITGCNRGLGLEFVRQYLQDGWQVHACCRHPEIAVDLQQLAKQQPHALQLHALDVADFKQIEKLGQQLQGKSIDLLLNNAGVYGGAQQQFGEIDYDAWLTTLKINTLAPIRMAEVFVHHVAQSTQKRMAHISSLMGSIADNQSGKSLIYRSSKAALNAAHKSLAIAVQPRGITSVVLHPGWVKTDMGGKTTAPMEISDSIRAMIKLIANLKGSDSGAFLNYDGTPLPW